MKNRGGWWQKTLAPDLCFTGSALPFFSCCFAWAEEIMNYSLLLPVNRLSEFSLDKLWHQKNSWRWQREKKWLCPDFIPIAFPSFLSSVWIFLEPSFSAAAFGTNHLEHTAIIARLKKKNVVAGDWLWFKTLWYASKLKSWTGIFFVYVGDIICCHGNSFHSYTSDAEFHLSVKPRSPQLP